MENLHFDLGKVAKIAGESLANILQKVSAEFAAIFFQKKVYT